MNTVMDSKLVDRILSSTHGMKTVVDSQWFRGKLHVVIAVTPQVQKLKLVRIFFSESQLDK